MLIIDQVVFDVPPELVQLRHNAGEQRSIYEAPGHAFKNEPEIFRAVLEASLSGWIDLRVLFSPSDHALCADHDEYTTVFSESSDRVAEVNCVLGQGGVKNVQYTAKAP